ncbi:MAG: flagellar hook-length control protein FliK [Planctomycetes bacterium]|nr:flagellar hook-length control protein FliK [Planctomycetota bacterium]
MLPLTAIFETSDCAQDRPRRKENVAGFEPVLMQALAAAPAANDSRENFSDREVATTPHEPGEAAVEQSSPENHAAAMPEQDVEGAAQEFPDAPPAATSKTASAPFEVASPAMVADVPAPQDESPREEDAAIAEEYPPAASVDAESTSVAELIDAPPVDAAPPDVAATEAPADPEAEENAAAVAAADAEQPIVEESETTEPKAPDAKANAAIAATESGTGALARADVGEGPTSLKLRRGTVHATSDSQSAPAGKTSTLRDGASAQPAADVRANKAEARQAVQAAPDALGTRVVEQVQRAMKTLTMRKGAGDVEARISLSPPSLGSLRLTVRVSDGELSGSVLTDNAAARHLLQTHLPELREALAQQGLTLGQFNVSQDAPFGDAQGRHDRGRFTPRASYRINSESLEPAAPPQVASVVAGRVQGYM